MSPRPMRASVSQDAHDAPGLSPRPDLTRLPAMLTRLKLTAVRDQLDTLLDEAARSELTRLHALGHGGTPAGG